MQTQYKECDIVHLTCKCLLPWPSLVLPHTSLLQTPASRQNITTHMLLGICKRSLGLIPFSINVWDITREWSHPSWRQVHANKMSWRTGWPRCPDMQYIDQWCHDDDIRRDRVEHLLAIASDCKTRMHMPFWSTNHTSFSCNTTLVSSFPGDLLLNSNHDQNFWQAHIAQSMEALNKMKTRYYVGASSDHSSDNKHKPQHIFQSNIVCIQCRHSSSSHTLTLVMLALDDSLSTSPLQAVPYHHVPCQFLPCH